MLIIDSGSTKADWVHIGENGLEYFETEGINPLFQGEEQIISIIHGTDIPYLAGKIDEVFFYGASCSTPERVEIIGKALEHVFPGASIRVTHDLMGAAKATCGDDPGMVCILGTGSSAGYYNGREIQRINRSLGFILGDEGSGAWFGKRIITDFLYGRLDDPLTKRFGLAFPEINVDYVINRVYRVPDPNRFLASVMPFLAEHRKQPYVAQLLHDGFKEFLDIHVLHGNIDHPVKVNAVGSVAHFFREELEAVMQELDLVPGAIVRRPIEGLVVYHQTGNS